ncbi:MAG: OmpA family protein [Verrucomicrobiota bacterium]
MKILGTLFILALVLFSVLHVLHYQKVEKPKLLDEAQSLLASANLDLSPPYSPGGMDVMLRGSVETLEKREEAERIVDDIFGLRALSIHNQIGAPGMFQTAYDPRTMQVMIRGSLGSKSTVDELKAAIQKGGKIPVRDRVKIHRQIKEPSYLKSERFLDLVRSMHKTPQPVSIVAGEHSLRLEGPATEEMRTQWMGMIRDIERAKGKSLEVETDFQLFPSLYHMPGYFRTRRSYELNRDAFNRFAAKLKLHQIYFDSGSSNVDYNDPVTKSALEQLATLINQYRNVFFVIGGHADARGSAQANQRLSKQRAEAVKEWLVSMRNIDAERLAIVSFGSTMAGGNQNSPEARAKARRVELLIQ